MFLKQEIDFFTCLPVQEQKKKSSGANADGIITIKIEQL
jgi:hypothetical protein